MPERVPQAARPLAGLVLEIVSATQTEPGSRTHALAEQLVDAGVSSAEVEEILDTVAEVQRFSGRLRQRTIELEALVSTAHELVRLQDVTDVLSRLVERAHGLIGTDVTYLSELENERGDLRVRYSKGTVTPEFRDLLVPAGYGLASMVASSREPVRVRRYERAQEAVHYPRIDEAVIGEGLVSFLGVPLAVGDEVLGVLFACNRFEYSFSPEQVLLLSAFADHAAAVLHSARVLAENAAARERAEHAYEQLEAHLAETETANAIHEELTAAVMSGGTVVDLVSTLSLRLNRRVWALDEAGRSLEVLSGGGGALPPHPALVSAISESQRTGQAASLAWEGQRWLLVAILGAERVLGAMVAEDAAEQSSQSRRTLERAAQVAALVSFKQEAVQSVRAARRSRHLLDLIDGHEGEGDRGNPQLTLSGELRACAVIEVHERNAALAAASAARMVGDAGLVAHREGRLIAAWAVEDPKAATERLRGFLADHLREPGLRAVVVSNIADAAALGPAMLRATRDLRFLGPLGIGAGTVGSESFAPYHVLTSEQPESVRAFVEEVLGPIIAWDRRRSTELVDTLGEFFNSGENRQLTAASMNLHKNTVQQRLDRIQALLSGDWGDPEFRFRLQAAVRLERLRRSLVPRASTPAWRDDGNDRP